ncbi:dihydrofolate reductase family protein [Streptomyces formicae]|uniref:Dihydrofolate reductase family protein n=1 Tax=Streptomyces formicae TaxID=1616117 RepID=A0ABY3WV26_9ACTN|nr:dihydrofolate reductase family protein [Streptomyces formicae]UNM15955.1 dihydrofolate reductase family protein [Streptomyces formicae]
MTNVTADLMMSLDGCIAGPNAGVGNPGGDGGAALHAWMAGLASWRERQGLSGGAHNRDSEIVGEWFDATGAVVMGRTMFDSGEKFWGDNPPFRTPVFILTHRPRPAEVKQGGTTYTFVTDGVHGALDQARAAAGTRNVDIAGGAATVQQYLRAGLLDELQLHVLPLLFGEGLRLFDHLGVLHQELEPLRVVHTPNATHLKYRVVTPRTT